jgi:hypothetical protein
MQAHASIDIDCKKGAVACPECELESFSPQLTAEGGPKVHCFGGLYTFQALLQFETLQLPIFSYIAGAAWGLYSSSDYYNRDNS